MSARALTLALACAVGGGCATSKSAESRDLPAGLSSLSALLEGCAPDTAGETVIMRCADDVAFATHPYSEGTEATYKLEASSLANTLGAQLQWDQVVVPTEAESGLVDRGRALGVADETPLATMVGVIHRLDDGTTEEVWCTSKSVAGGERCKELVGAAIGRHDGVVVKKANPKGPATFLGRSLSMPTTCEVQNASKTAGSIECDNGTSLAWSAFQSMDDAVQALHARLNAAGEDDEGTAFDCAIGGEVAQCEQRGHSVAGVTYIDGKAVMVVCMGPTDLKNDGMCRSVILPR